MKQYYLIESGLKNGPYTLEQLSTKNPTRETLVWYEGLEDWTPAKDASELSALLNQIPPPIPPFKHTPKKNKVLLVSVAIVALLVVFAILKPFGNNEPQKREKNDLLTDDTITKSTVISNPTEKITTTPVSNPRVEALRKFDLYSPKIVESNDAAIANTEVYVGDLNHDNIDDAIVFFVLTPKEGGNALMGMGMVAYLNQGGEMKVAAGFEPDYVFNVHEIANNKVHIIRKDFAEDDGRYPSIESHEYFILNGKKFQKSNVVD